jgi:hypothetical protein
MAFSVDPAGRLASIDVSGGTSEDVAFSIDALGRQTSKAVGGATPTLYAYLGTSNHVSSTGTSSIEWGIGGTTPMTR